MLSKLSKKEKNKIEKLIKEGRFFELYEKHGNDKYLYKALYNDVLENTGSRGKAFSIVNARKVSYYSKLWLFTLGFLSSVILSELPSISYDLNEESELQYEKEIEDYNKNLEEYINGLELDGLSDLEIIMKVVDDMWNSIEGYKTPDIDAWGYYRLDIPNGYGVCRNMADDITAKLNAINPDYNARNLVVYSEFGDWSSADIEMRNLNSPSVGNESVPNKFEQYWIENLRGNHMVTLVDLNDKNVTLVIDPTNAGIGVLKNGKIEMFNSTNEKFKIVSLFNYMSNGYKENFELELYKLDSFTNLDSIEELNEKYGLDAQNQALKKVRN